MLEYLGVSGRQLFVRVDCNLGEGELLLLVQHNITLFFLYFYTHNITLFFLYFYFYGRPCNCGNVLIHLSCILCTGCISVTICQNVRIIIL